MTTIEQLIEMVQEIDVPNTFNPYTDICEVHDNEQSPIIRTENLRRYLHWIEDTGCRILGVGESPGWRGARRVGIPFSDDYIEQDIQRIFPNLEGMRKATVSGYVKEASASIMYEILEQTDKTIALWNATPLHPHKEGEPFTNRKPLKSDWEACEPFTLALLEYFNFDRIIAIGKTAQKYLQKYGYSVVYARHPSYGGKKKFMKTMFAELGKKEPEVTLDNFFTW